MQTQMNQMSLFAYQSIKEDLGKKQKEVYQCFFRAQKPLSNRQVSDLLRWPINTVTPRVNELVSMGRLGKAGRQMNPLTGRSETTWEIINGKG